MKKIALIATSIAISTAATAQVSVTKILSYTPGAISTKAYNTIELNTTIKKMLPGGNGVTWSYDTCLKTTATPPAYSLTTKDTTGVINSASVAGRANMALKEGASINHSFYNYGSQFSIAAEAFTILSNDAYVAYDNNINLLTFPIIYGSSVVSFDTATSWQFPPNNTMKRIMKSTMTYDGYGTLKLNNTLIIDSVCRIKLVQAIKDTLIAPANPFLNKIISKRTVYYYVRAGKNLVAQWEVDSVSSALVTQKIYKFIVADKYSGTLGVSNKNNQITKVMCYPNPTHDVVKVAIANENYTPYEVYNAQGKIVIKGAMNKTNNSVDVSNLNNGMYIFKTTDGKQEASFVKE
jgi:hypothetical protein